MNPINLRRESCGMLKVADVAKKRRRVEELYCLTEDKNKHRRVYLKPPRRNVSISRTNHVSISRTISRTNRGPHLKHSSIPTCLPKHHPGFFGGLCVLCGQAQDDDDDDDDAVLLGYINPYLKLCNDEMARVRSIDMESLLGRKKLYLILDLDHTLFNSTRLKDTTLDEDYLIKSQTDYGGSFFRRDSIQMLTKLRPGVHTFLEEASKLFEMSIYTMGERPYALEMVKLLDPGNMYFNSIVISHDDCTHRHQKSLDVFLGQESAVLILDDTQSVWGKHKENLILMERYCFFGSSCRQFGFNCKSLSELKSDESETNGALASVLTALKKIHSTFFEPKLGVDLSRRDVRHVLKTVRRDVLKGCKVVFSRVFPTDFEAENHHLWKMAESLGATCLTEVDPSVTHVVSKDPRTEKCRWTIEQKKSLVNPRWIESANYLWQKLPEVNFPVNQVKNELFPFEPTPARKHFKVRKIT